MNRPDMISHGLLAPIARLTSFALKSLVCLPELEILEDIFDFTQFRHHGRNTTEQEMFSQTRSSLKNLLAF
jgi:hypothetical protein